MWPACARGRPRAPRIRRPSCIHRGPGTRALAGGGVARRWRSARRGPRGRATVAAGITLTVVAAVSDDRVPGVQRFVSTPPPRQQRAGRRHAAVSGADADFDF